MLLLYSTQSDSTARVRLPQLGSLLGMYTRKSCGPPIPSCIVKDICRVVLSPGFRAIEPMAGLGGQHPSSTSI
jgi:hypothetical protein